MQITWKQEVQRLRRLINRKEHDHAAIGFVGMSKKLLRSDMSFPEFSDDKDGSAVKGIIFALLLTFFVITIIGALYIAFKPTNAHAAETASWYGVTGDHTDPWKHAMTASGQKFNENAMTCASWRFPLRSHIRVTNLKNGRSVVVLVNDRGPSRRLAKMGRTVDLTRAAFARIGSLRDGVIPIQTVLVRVSS